MQPIRSRVQRLLPAKLRPARDAVESETVINSAYSHFTDVAPTQQDTTALIEGQQLTGAAGDSTREAPAPAKSKRLQLDSITKSIPFLKKKQQQSSAPVTRPVTATPAGNSRAAAASEQREAVGCFHGVLAHGAATSSTPAPRSADARRQQILDRLSQSAKPKPAAKPHSAEEAKSKKVQAKPDRDALQAAAWKGELAQVQALLRQGVLVTGRDKSGLTALHYASWHGHLDIMEELMTAGAPAAIKDVDGLTPLHYAAWGGQVDAASLLLERNVPVDAVTTSRTARYTPLYYAAKMGHVALVQLLLTRGARWDGGGDKAGAASPLHEAAWCGHADVVAELLRHGAQHDCPTQGEQYRCLHLAALANQGAVIQVLVYYGGNVNARTRAGRTALHLAAKKGFLAVCQQLLQAHADPNLRDKAGRTPLHLAVEQGHLQLVNVMLEAGARCCGSSKYPDALHYATDRHLRKLLLGLERYGPGPLHLPSGVTRSASSRFALATSSNLAAHQVQLAAAAAPGGVVNPVSADVARVTAAAGQLMRYSSGGSSTESSRRRRLLGGGAATLEASGNSQTAAAAASRLRYGSLSSVEGDACAAAAAAALTAGASAPAAAVAPADTTRAAPATAVAAAPAGTGGLVQPAAVVGPAAAPAAGVSAPAAATATAVGSAGTSSSASPTDWFVPEEVTVAAGGTGDAPAVAAAGVAADAVTVEVAVVPVVDAAKPNAAEHEQNLMLMRSLGALPALGGLSIADSADASSVQARQGSMEGSGSGGAAAELVAELRAQLQDDSGWSSISLSEGPVAPQNSISSTAGGTARQPAAAAAAGAGAVDEERDTESPQGVSAEDAELLSQIKRMLGATSEGAAQRAKQAAGEAWELDAFLRQPASVSIDAAQGKASPDMSDIADCQRLLADQRITSHCSTGAGSSTAIATSKPAPAAQSGAARYVRP